MLEPHARTLLFDVLRPPEDHALDFVLGTTYTLDLVALLTAPVAFTLFEADDHRALRDGDSLALLETLRRYADRMTIFCQAGRIGVPREKYPQLEYLEGSVIECRAAVPGASFHPKVWLLRFTGPEELVTYRLACLTRNLTFDRCWDTVLTLEGPLLDRRKAIAVNRPLGDFVQALPSLAVRQPVQAIVADRVAQMQEEVRRVAFELPEGFEDLSFHPIGIDGYRRFPFDGGDGRMLVVSPFVAGRGLRRLVRNRPGSILVSRPETLEERACRADEIDEFYVLASEADPAESDDKAQQTGRGLHAKCYIADSGARAVVWTGSANATEAAFNGNVEFLVKLTGPRRRFGIDALFGQEDGRTSFGDLLQPFTPTDGEEDRPSPRDRFEDVVDAIRNALAGCELGARVSQPEGSDVFIVALAARRPAVSWPDGASVNCWPVTLGRGWQRPIAPGRLTATFEGVSLEGLTAFFAFEVEASVDEETFTEAFVLNVPLDGAPPDRRERLLRSAIKDRKGLVRYLLLLLAQEGIELADVLRGIARDGSRQTGDGRREAGASLFEVFVRALERSPERLDHVAKLIEDLKRQDGAEDLFPAGFEEIWAPLWEARQRSR